MIGDALAAALPMMRAQAESLMVDACVIERASGTHWDEALQKSVTTWTLVASSPCHFDTEPAPTRSLVTDEVVSQRSPSVRLPHTVLGVKPDDRVTITAVGAESDPAQLGAVVWVTHVATDSHPVERIVECRWVK